MRQTRLRSSTAFANTGQKGWRECTWFFCAAALVWTAGIAVPAHSQEPPAPEVQSLDTAPGTEPSPSMSPSSGDGVLPQPAVSGEETQTTPAQMNGQQELPAPSQPGEAPAAVPDAPAFSPNPPAFAPNANGFANSGDQTLSQARSDLPHDLSPWGMYMAADIIVKAVMILLAVASVISWTIWFAKLAQVTFATKRLQRGLKQLDKDISLAVAADRRRSNAPLAVMLAAARDEVIRSENGLLPAAGIKERVSSQLIRIEAAASRTMSSGTGMLATIGATAPFIGLFGTVWGIMNSFIGISEAQTTNLAVVAPGIAEALLATGLGLVAAIPAVIFYNHLARLISGYKARLADCGAMIERMVSRDLDRQSTQGPK